VTPSHTPQPNGIDDRKNRTLLDMVNAMLLSSDLPNSCWGEALYSTFLILSLLKILKRKSLWII